MSGKKKRIHHHQQKFPILLEQIVDMEFIKGKRKIVELDDLPKGHGDIKNLEDFVLEEEFPDTMIEYINKGKHKKIFLLEAPVKEHGDDNREDESLEVSEEV